MCGISFLAQPDSRINLADQLQPMTDLIRHRGPDDAGYLYFSHDQGYALSAPASCQSHEGIHPLPASDALPKTELRVAMGHRRLSILDLSAAGHQPMGDPSGRFWIVYNGEIYNYAHLREELKQAGHRFYSDCDTEVLIAAYVHWGADCLHHLNGMFSFVLYDRRQHRIFAARDRFGIKPFYYWIAPSGYLAIASEIKQFTVLPDWQASLNANTARQYLMHGNLDHGDETLFAGVKQLRGGESLSCGLDTLTTPCVTRWYDLAAHAAPCHDHNPVETFRELLTDAVRLRCRADVEVGSSLSGGLDSSSIVCLANQFLRTHNAQHQQRTFSACSEHKAYDERPFIEQVSQHTGVSSAYVFPDIDDLFAQISDLTWTQDEPFGSTSMFAQWKVFELAASSGVTVMLDGQGADEILAGYMSFFDPYFAELWQHKQPRKLAYELRKAHQHHGIGMGRRLLALILSRLPASLQHRIRGHDMAHRMQQQGLNSKHLPDSGPQHSATQNTVRQHALFQLGMRSIPQLLHWEDRNSMAHSLETRLPFLDYRLVEFALGLPADQLLSDGMTKQILRRAMHGILPPGIQQRVDKKGFVTPERVWMTQQHAPHFRNSLKDSIDASQGLLSEHLLHHFDRVLSGREAYSWWLWRAFNFGVWMNTFSVRAP